ncbi:MAG: OB-fold nucleic acid binding domain-containing protein [Ignavibacteriaceae bacterium]
MHRLSIIILVLLAIGFTACEKKEEPKENTSKEEAMPAENLHKVVVLDNMDASQYTYLKVKENDSEYWIAVPQMEVQKGETLYFGKSMEMKNFHSETLNKTFDSVLFVDHVSKTPNEMTSVPNHPKLNSVKEDVSVKPVSGGKTIAQIYADKSSLAGKTVTVRGKVTKFNPNIMGRNWIHIQDGTGSANNYDLMITSKDIVKVGDVVVAEGTVAVNKDFGAGYSYPVMVEDASVKAEKSM